MKRLVLALIRFYRKNISPSRPPCCRFIPTCSTYALEAVEVHGAFKGSLLAIWRVLRCHPFHRDKNFIYDPVPPKKIRYPKANCKKTCQASAQGAKQAPAPRAGTGHTARKSVDDKGGSGFAQSEFISPEH